MRRAQAQKRRCGCHITAGRAADFARTFAPVPWRAHLIPAVAFSDWGQACKNKQGKYQSAGIARLSYDCPGYDGLVVDQPASGQTCNNLAAEVGDRLA